MPHSCSSSNRCLASLAWPASVFLVGFLQLGTEPWRCRHGSDSVLSQKRLRVREGHWLRRVVSNQTDPCRRAMWFYKLSQTCRQCLETCCFEIHSSQSTFLSRETRWFLGHTLACPAEGCFSLFLCARCYICVLSFRSLLMVD